MSRQVSSRHENVVTIAATNFDWSWVLDDDMLVTVIDVSGDVLCGGI